MNDTTFVIAALTPCPTLYSYAEDYPDALQKAVEANLREKDFQQEGEARRNWSIMTEADYERHQREYYLARPPVEITAERFDEMLNILPPMRWEHRDGVERFLMSELTAASFTTQFAKRNGRYFEKTVDAHDRSTWINSELLDRLTFARREDERRMSAEGRGK